MDDHTTSGFSPLHMQSSHINRLELEAVFLAFQHFQKFLPKGHIKVFSDHTTVVALLNRQGGTHAPILSIRVEEILLWAHEQGWILSAQHIAGNANVMADLLSRQDTIFPTEWTLTHNTLQ